MSVGVGVRAWACGRGRVDVGVEWVFGHGYVASRCVSVWTWVCGVWGSLSMNGCACN